MSGVPIILPKGGSVGDLSQWNGTGWSALSIGTSGKALCAGSTGHAYKWRIYRVVVVANPFATGVWTNMPAAESFFNGTDGTLSTVDLADFTQCRLQVWKGTTAGVAGSKLYAKYYTGGGATSVGNYAALGTSSVEVAIDTTSTALSSGWVNLAAGAIADDTLVAVTGDGGDGVVDPRFGNIAIEFK